MLRLILSVLLVMISCEAVAEKFIAPPKRIVKIAKQLEYPDFPTYLDILSICAVESAYKIKAINPEKGVPSVGVMQVRKGSKDLDKNMFEGVGILRQYYKILGDSESAVRSYNIGVGTFKAGKAKISADEYYSRFVKRRSELVKYFEKDMK